MIFGSFWLARESIQQKIFDHLLFTTKVIGKATELGLGKTKAACRQRSLVKCISTMTFRKSSA